MPKETSRWSMLAILCLYVFAFYLVWQEVPPIMSLIIEDLDISHAQAGLFMSIFSLPVIVFTIPLGFWSHRIGIKRIGIIALSLLLTGSVVVMLARSFPVMLLGRTITGVGIVSLPFVGLQGVAMWFRQRQLGLAMGIYSTFMLLSPWITLSSFGSLGLLWGWRSTGLIAIGVSAVALVIFSIFFRLPAGRPQEDRKGIAAKDAASKLGWPLWLLTIGWGFFGMAMTSVIAFLPDFMYLNSFGLGTAGFITGTIMLSSLIMSPVVGYIYDRTKYKQILLLVGSAVSSTAIFLIPTGINYIALLTVLIGVFTAASAPVVWALAPSMVKSGLRAFVFGFITMINQIGAFAGPYLAGWIRDASGSYQYSFWFMGAMYLLFFLISGVLLIKEVRSGLLVKD